MIDGKRVVVVLPAYNAARTLRATYDALPLSVIDRVLLVDDASSDQTVAIASELGITSRVHPENRGYGANQKTCYAAALEEDADIVIMVHPDYQYSPRLTGAMAWMISSGEYDLVLGSRILGGRAREGGMPLYKYVSNRALTAFQNLMQGSKLSEFHTGYRAFSREVLETLPLGENADGFLFDNQMLAQALFFGFRLGEISCPTRYFEEASSIDLASSIVYGMGVLRTSIEFRLGRMGIRAPYLRPEGRRLSLPDGR